MDEDIVEFAHGVERDGEQQKATLQIMSELGLESNEWEIVIVIVRSRRASRPFIDGNQSFRFGKAGQR